MKMAEVHHLSFTSRSIRETLRYHAGMKQFGHHAFFATLDSFDKAGMSGLINRATGTSHFVKNDLVFEEGSLRERAHDCLLYTGCSPTASCFPR